MTFISMANNLTSHRFQINKMDRVLLNEHYPKVFWLTGLSGSGKSTLADAIEVRMYSCGLHTFILDGDNIRSGLSKDLSFTDDDRAENIRRISEVAKLMVDAGLVVIVAFISPFKKDRETAKTIIGAENFVEIFVDAPLSLCQQRDPKGLYKLANEGKIANMTGVHSIYEPPSFPDFIADTSSNQPSELAENIWQTFYTSLVKGQK